MGNLSSDAYAAFKVKTTKPKKYCVRPNQGKIPPQGVVEVQVILSPQSEMPAELDKHKFLVQAMACGADTEVTRELFDGKESKVMDTRLTVAYVTRARGKVLQKGASQVAGEGHRSASCVRRTRNSGVTSRSSKRRRSCWIKMGLLASRSQVDSRSCTSLSSRSSPSFSGDSLRCYHANDEAVVRGYF